MDPQTQLLENPDTLRAIKYDVAQSSLAYVQTYLLEENFFAELFHGYLSTYELHVLTDYRQTPIARELLGRYKNLRIRTWSRNRTMHTKALLFWPLQVVYVGSHNLTRGSFTMSLNTTVRIATPTFFDAAISAFRTMYDRARPLTPVV